VPYAVIFYLGKILLPAGLSCVYPYSGIKDISIYLFSLAGCFAIPVLMIRSAKYTKKVVFGILFFLVTLLPVLQFIPMGSTIAADRYAYMASVGFFYLIAEGIVWAYGKTAEKNRRLGVALIIVLLILITGSLSVLTWNRCAVWKDDITLWGDVLSKYPNALAYNRRGIYFAERKDYDRALGDFKKVLLYAPYDTDVYINLGNLYNAMGENNKAITTFKRGLKMGTEPAVSYFSLATTYLELGNNEIAISFYKKTLELAPDNAVVCYSLGMLYKKLGKNDDAIQMLSRTVEIAPGFLLPYPTLSQFYEEAGKRAEQFALYRQAIAHDVPFYTAYYDIGNLDLEQGDIKSSIRMFQRAVEISPSSAEGYVSLASAHCALGQTKKAILLLTKALEINPKIAVAHNNIAVAYYLPKAIRPGDPAL
jgi:tetratricopeptide (TPR) repeat protein